MVDNEVLLNADSFYVSKWEQKSKNDMGTALQYSEKLKAVYSIVCSFQHTLN